MGMAQVLCGGVLGGLVPYDDRSGIKHHHTATNWQPPVGDAIGVRRCVWMSVFVKRPLGSCSLPPRLYVEIDFNSSIDLR